MVRTEAEAATLTRSQRAAGSGVPGVGGGFLARSSDAPTKPRVHFPAQLSPARYASQEQYSPKRQQKEVLHKNGARRREGKTSPVHTQAAHPLGTARRRRKHGRWGGGVGAEPPVCRCLAPRELEALFLPSLFAEPLGGSFPDSGALGITSEDPGASPPHSPRQTVLSWRWPESGGLLGHPCPEVPRRSVRFLTPVILSTSISSVLLFPSLKREANNKTPSSACKDGGRSCTSLAVVGEI